MYSEIVGAEVEYYYDRATQTAIGYAADKSKDQWTEMGTWFSYNDRNSIEAITQYISKSKTITLLLLPHIIHCFPIQRKHSISVTTTKL